MNKIYYQQLFAYNRWANERTREFVSKLDADFLDESVSSSFPTIRKTLEHLVMAEWLWLERIKNGNSPDKPFNGEIFPDLEALFQKWNDVETQYAELLGNITDERILDFIDYKNLAGEPNSRQTGHILSHVVNHGTYHRGQITTFLRQFNAEATTTDLIYYDFQLK